MHRCKRWSCTLLIVWNIFQLPLFPMPVHMNNNWHNASFYVSFLSKCITLNSYGLYSTDYFVHESVNEITEVHSFFFPLVYLCLILQIQFLIQRYLKREIIKANCNHVLSYLYNIISLLRVIRFFAATQEFRCPLNWIQAGSECFKFSEDNGVTWHEAMVYILIFILMYN